MHRVTLFSQVGPDGVLNVSVPLSPNDANTAVQVTIEPTSNGVASSPDYESWLEGLPGRWQGDLDRGNEGNFEIRESLS